MLQEGTVAEQGSHDELMMIPGGVYRRLWEAQLTENTQTPIGIEGEKVEAREGGDEGRPEETRIEQARMEEVRLASVRRGNGNDGGQAST